MVVFTCNNCGSSMKKNQVEKHYMLKCKHGPISVSCMDCNKDFKEDYQDHVKCITESEKYGKDYAPKNSTIKKEKKQADWIELIKNLPNTEKKLGVQEKAALEKLAQFNVVPMKKTKFLNFAHNSLKGVPQTVLNNVWNIIEKKAEENGFLNKATPSTSEGTLQETQRVELTKSDKKNKSKSKHKNGETEENMEITDEQCKSQSMKSDNDIHAINGKNKDMNSEDVPNVCNKSKSLSKKEKKAKRKQEKYEKSGRDEDEESQSIKLSVNEIGAINGKNKDMNSEETDILNDCNSKQLSKKERKAKQKQEKCEEAKCNAVKLEFQDVKSSLNEIHAVNCKSTEVNSEKAADALNDCNKSESLSKKERKAKRKREKYEKELLEIENTQAQNTMENCSETCEPETVEPAKKKKKKKLAYDHESGDPVTEQESKQMKNSKKCAQEVDLDNIHNDNCIPKEDNASEGNVDVEHKKFNWEEVIVKALQSKGELPLKRLEKKIVNEYINSGMHVKSKEKVLAKFHKKVMHIPGVNIKKEIVKLMK